MSIRLLSTATAALLLSGASCDITSPDLDQLGTVEFVDVEGGCWTIESNGETYEPINLPEEMREDGLAVEFEATVRDDMASICQVGTIVELVRIRAAT